MIEKDIVNLPSFAPPPIHREHRNDVPPLIFFDSTKRRRKTFKLLYFSLFSIFFLHSSNNHEKWKTNFHAIKQNKKTITNKKVPNIGDYNNESGEDKMPLVTIL